MSGQPPAPETLAETIREAMGPLAHSEHRKAALDALDSLLARVRAAEDALAALAGEPAMVDRLREAVRDAATLRETLEWLLTLDDPEDVIGREERRSVTLTQIIDRARAALAAAAPADEPAGDA